MVSSNIADLLHSSLIYAFKKYDQFALNTMYRGIAGSRDRGIDDPDLPLNLGSKIRSRSQFKFGIGSDRNGSEVIEIDRDREKIVDRQCTGNLYQNPHT